ncbi:class I SAM-dependent methyltransferase, partial [Petrachloros mirabilis]
TGLTDDSERVRGVYEFYARFGPINEKDILEIGPGQAVGVLERALKAGARSCTALDVIDYIPAARANDLSVAYRIYNGKTFPFESNRFDMVWSYTAFEHLRYPAITVEECFRVLRGGGRLVALIDLGDHSWYGKSDPDPLKLFDCLRYSEPLWNLMRWNRSSYVNRLRKSDWTRLFASAGFQFRHEESQVSEAIAQALPSLCYLHRYHREDATTHTLAVCLEKPSNSERR